MDQSSGDDGEDHKKRNTSTFGGHPIEFDDRGYIVGYGMYSIGARIAQSIYKLALFCFGPRTLIELIRSLRSVYASCFFYAPKEFSGQLCALTFDDAPGKDTSMCKEILDLLEEYGAKATFFITSDFLNFGRSHELLIERILREGHEIGNHMPEDKAYDTVSEKAFQEDLMRTESALNKLGWEPLRVFKHKWFRPPCGKLSKNMISVLEVNRYKVALGDVFANDVLFQDVAYLTKVADRFVQPGSIVILHMPDVGFREKNYEETKCILSLLKSKCLEAVPLSTLYTQWRKPLF